MKDKTSQERAKILRLWDRWFEIPLIFLGFCWLILVIVELTAGFNPLLENLSFTIWIIFILDFVIRFCLAPVKMQFLKSQWITVIALIVPAFRVLKSFQLLKVSRSIYLVKVAAAVRRGMQMLSIILGRHGFGYIMALTFVVILLGAAGMRTLENDFKNYGDALWWAAMMITTMGTDFWPKTIEGRILCFGLAIYGFAIFGYITATVASLLIEKDKKNKDEHEKILAAIQELKVELKSLNKELP